MNSAAIQDELKELGSTLSLADRAMPFAVPAGYFDDLATDALSFVQSAEAEHTLALPKEMPYVVPTAYFDELPVLLAAKTLIDEASLIKGTVPAGYFEGNPARMLVAAKKQDNIIKRPRKTIQFRHVRLAAAAVLLLCIGMGSYSTLMQGAFRKPQQLLSNVSKTEIQAYLDNSTGGAQDADDVEISALAFDNKEIVAYLDETGWE